MGQFDSVIKEWPTEKNAVIEAIHNKGLGYLWQQKYDKAEVEFNKIKSEELTRPQVLLNLCRCYKELGQIESLQKTLLVISRKWPEEAEKLREELEI